MDFADNALASVLGHPKKAFIIIHKNGSAPVKSKDIVEQTEKKLSSPIALFSAPGGVGAMDHVLQVQYNPSSISFQGNAFARQMKTLKQSDDDEIPTQLDRPPSVTMSVDLIFDACNNKDSFMMDKLRVSANDIASDVSAAIHAFKAPYSVQPQTNGLLAMVMFSKYNNVTFHWAETTFTGVVNEAQAKYTMFSVSGRPVRSVIQLKIRQRISGKADASYWNDAFDKCFGAENEAKKSGRQDIGQYTGNLLNLGF